MRGYVYLFVALVGEIPCNRNDVYHILNIYFIIIKYVEVVATAFPTRHALSLRRMFSIPYDLSVLSLGHVLSFPHILLP